MGMGKLRLIKTMPDGGPLSGWVFDIYRKSDNTHIGTFTSGEDGTILTGWLMPGEYLVQEQLDEKSIYWCASVNPQIVVLEPGKTAEVTFENRLKAGKIAIQKVDTTGEPLAWAEFLLEWSVDGTVWKPVTPAESLYVTEGTCSSEGLRDGKLELAFEPFVPEYLMPESGVVEATFLGRTHVIYHAAGHASLVPGKTKPVRYYVAYRDGWEQMIDAPVLSQTEVIAVREGKIARIDVYMA